MCGIVGFLGLSADANQFPDWLRSMLGAIEHRGPDEAGYYFDERAGLGASRLSIIDLAHGQQPMATADGRHWIAFNGEIFNYIELREELERIGVRLRTRSDTEVLLQALAVWGLDALAKLEGQFAFLFYEKDSGRLLFARDRWGERPLFYAAGGGGHVFASEIKALFTLPFVERRIDTKAAQRIAQFYASPPGETCFAGVSAVPPGHAGILEGGRMKIFPYYHLPVASQTEIGLDEAKERTLASLKESTRLRLRSDVPVGVYLSGGLDSTITTGLAVELSNHPLKSFSVEFEDQAFDEGQYQRAASRFFGTEHVPLRISTRDIAEHFGEAVRHAETVLFRTAPVPLYLLARKVREHGIKVVLTGEGADECFLGYHLFSEMRVRSQFAAMDDDRRARELARLYPNARRFQGEGLKRLAELFLRATKERVAGMFSHEMRFSPGRTFGRLFAEPTNPIENERALASIVRRIYPDFANVNATEKAQILEFLTNLPGYLLSSQGDRMTSAHGVESRYPFLDTGVVAAAFSIPERLRLTDEYREKYVLAEAFRDRLPPEITDRPKRPYQAPGSICFLGPDAPERVQELLQPANLTALGLDADRVAAFLPKPWGRGPDAAQRNAAAFEISFSCLLSLAELDDIFIRRPYAARFNEKLLRVAADGRGLH